ncbi:uncharacterized protein LOC115213921 [Argonauta hians]
MLRFLNFLRYLHRMKIVYLVLMAMLAVSIVFMNTEIFLMKKHIASKFIKVKPTTQFCTIFTSWVTTEEKKNVHNNTLRLWTQLSSKIQPVLFTNDSVLAKQAIAYGWKILPILHTTCGNIPVLKSMFLDIQRNFPSRIYGYANSDILFDNSLETTLQAVSKYEKLYTNNGFLITGRRMNVNFANLTVDSLLNLTSKATKGSLAKVWGEDYFFTDNNFPWNIFPNMVIGRVAIDNYIVMFSNKNKVDTVDGTLSILAIHQTTQDGNLASSKKPNAKCNVKLVGNKKYRQGFSDCISLETRYDFQNEIQIIKRKIPPTCH